MSRDLQQLLQGTAVEPADRPDPSMLVLRGRRRRRRRHAVGAVSGIAAVVLVAVAVLQLPSDPGPEILDQPPGSERPVPATPVPDGDGEGVVVAQPLSWPDGPSQTPADAAAQGVPAEVAALPVADRIQLRGGTQAPEGLYVTSGLPFDVAQDIADTADGRLSNGTGSSEYEELLLLDPDTLTIQQAWPTAGLSFHEPPTVLDDPDIVVAIRSGDGAEPWDGVIVIDRDSGEPRGYVSVPSDVRTDSPWTDTDWVTVNPPDPPPTTILGTIDGLLAAPGEGSVLLYDPATFEVAGELARHDGAVTELARAGLSTLVERGTPPAAFLELTPAGISQRGDLPDFPGHVTAADASGTALVVSFDDGSGLLWALREQAWVPVFDGGTHPVLLHRTTDATWATGYDWRTGGVLFRDGSRVAERPFRTDAEQPVGQGKDVVASRADGTLLWISRDLPYLVPSGQDVSESPSPVMEPPSVPLLEGLGAPRLVVEHADGVWAQLDGGPWRLLGGAQDVRVVGEGRWWFRPGEEPVLRSVTDPDVTCTPPDGFLDVEWHAAVIHEDGLTSVFVAAEDGTVASVVCEDPELTSPIDWRPPTEQGEAEFGPFVQVEDGITLVSYSDAEGNVTVYDETEQRQLIPYAISGPMVDAEWGLMVYVAQEGGMHFAGGTLVVTDLDGGELRRVELGDTSHLSGFTDGFAVVERVRMPEFATTHHIVVDVTSGTIVGEEATPAGIRYVGP